MIQECSLWDETFFNKFISISHRNYLRHPDYIKETLDIFKDMLAADAPFNQRNAWKAWIVLEQGKVVGRVFASTREDKFKQSDFLPFGYFEADSFEVAKELFKAVEVFAKEKNYKTIRGPIAGNVFNSSRLITKQTRKLFLSEPLHRPEYIDYFKQYNFQVSQKWITGYFDFWQRVFGIYDYLKKYKKSTYRKKNYHIRHIDMNRWEEELELFYDLMMDSYSSMEDVELISLEEFKVWNDGLKHLIQPKNCLILEHEGEPLGFSLCLRDRRREIARISKNPSLFNKLIFAIRQKFSMGLLLMNYIGKRRDAEDKIKGISLKMFSRMAKIYNGFIFTPLVFGFMSKGSKTVDIVTQQYRISSEYCIFQKHLTI